MHYLGLNPNLEVLVEGIEVVPDSETDNLPFSWLLNKKVLRKALHLIALTELCNVKDKAELPGSEGEKLEVKFPIVNGGQSDLIRGL